MISVWKFIFTFSNHRRFQASLHPPIVTTSFIRIPFPNDTVAFSSVSEPLLSLKNKNEPRTHWHGARVNQ